MHAVHARAAGRQHAPAALALTLCSRTSHHGGSQQLSGRASAGCKGPATHASRAARAHLGVVHRIARGLPLLCSCSCRHHCTILCALLPHAALSPGHARACPTDMARVHAPAVTHPMLPMLPMLLLLLLQEAQVTRTKEEALAMIEVGGGSGAAGPACLPALRSTTHSCPPSMPGVQQAHGSSALSCLTTPACPPRCRPSVSSLCLVTSTLPPWPARRATAAAPAGEATSATSGEGGG
jgi:hypothetical protein